MDLTPFVCDPFVCDNFALNDTHEYFPMTVRLWLFFVCIAALVLALSACGSAETPAPTTASNNVASIPPKQADTALTEPGEEDMRALEEAAIKALNDSGGMVIEMSGVRSKPIKMKLESYRKTGCKPYTRAFRCEADVGLSYPDTDFPDETLPSSHRYQKDDQGRWTRD